MSGSKGSTLNLDRFVWLWRLQAWALARLRRVANLHLWVVLTRAIDPHRVLDPDLEARFIFRTVTLDEAKNAPSDMQMSRKFVDDAAARGDVVAGVFDGSRLIAYSWRSETRAPITDHLWWQLEPGQHTRYGYKSFVHPHYRGMRLAQSLGQSADPDYAARGITKDVSYVDLDNLASLRSNFRNPTRRVVGLAGYWQIGKKYWTFRTPGARRYFSFELTP